MKPLKRNYVAHELQLSLKLKLNGGPRPPRAQFSAPSRKTSSARTSSTRVRNTVRQTSWTRGASSNARGGRGPQLRFSDSFPAMPTCGRTLQLGQPTLIEAMLRINHSKGTELGSAGDSPASVGDPPTGTAEVNTARRPSPLARNVAAVPSGESPEGTGGTPVLPENGDDCTQDACAPQRTESFRRGDAFIARTCAAAQLRKTFTLGDGVDARGLIISGSTMYGVDSGGSGGSGVVFKLNTDGTGFTILYNFTAPTGQNHGGPINDDGAGPFTLILSGNVLYGTANGGGRWGNGTVFALSTDGSNFATLHNFTDDNGTLINGDGIAPLVLISSGSALYGTTAQFNSTSGYGTAFTISTNGTGFSTLYSFSGVGRGGNCDYMLTNRDGVWPYGVTLSGITLYGTASYGGSGGSGTIFSISLPPPLTITAAGANVVLTWPTDATGFTLLSAPALTATFTNIPGATSPYTNAITASEQFFRLATP